MSLIAQLGLLGWSSVFTFACLGIYRFQARPESRAGIAVLYIFVLRMGTPILDGFSISTATKSALGQLNTIFAYIFLALAFFEVVTSKKVMKWRGKDYFVLIGLFALCIMYIFWKIYLAGSFRSSDFPYLLSLLLVAILKPTLDDLRFLPFAGYVFVSLLFLLAALRYQNPNYPYFQEDYGMSGPYHNVIWDIFGIRERFRGPYMHPNHLGMHVVFFSILMMIRNSKLNLIFLSMSYVLLALAASRTSILALTCALCVFFLHSIQKRKGSSRLESVVVLKSKRKSLRSQNPVMRVLIFTIVCVVVYFLIDRIVISNLTLTGRTDAYQNTLNALSGGGWVLGIGPSINSINNVENTPLTLLSYYGLLGIISYISCLIGCLITLRTGPESTKSLSRCIFTAFTVAGMGEFIMASSVTDVGCSYLLLILLTNRNQMTEI